MKQTSISDNPWAIHLPEPGKPCPTTPSALGPKKDRAEETVLARVTELLSSQRKTPFRLGNGEHYLASPSEESPVSGPMIDAALYAARRRYAYNSPPGCRRSGDRIQRLVLGIAELLQAEFFKDPDSDADEFEDELQATLRCLEAGFRETAETNSPGVADTGFDDFNSDQDSGAED